jgi:predicted enzyme related to lactoylglutathione lyase
MAGTGSNHLEIPALDVEPRTPGSLTVASLEAALRLVERLGGSITSETRTAPGIGSWAFVADGAGNELVLWEGAS